jgi:hypothetical protein
MKLRRAVLILILSVAFVGACGGGDDDDASSEPAASADSDSDGDAVGAFTASRCADEARRMAEAQAASLQAATGGTDTLEEAADAFDEMADAAPSEIRADMRILAEAYAAYVSIIADANFNPASGQAPSAETMEKLQEAAEKFDNDEFKAASERVTKWFAEECGQ